MTTVRDLVHEMQRELRDTDLLPERAAELLMRGSALIGNVLDEIRAADAAYSAVLLASLAAHDKANRAKIYAETTPEYQRKREARDTREVLQEMIGALKYYLRGKADELREAKYQP